MHCRDAKHLMANPGWRNNHRLMTHLKECSDCAVVAEAQAELDFLLREEAIESTRPLGDVRRGVELAASKKNRWEKLMSTIQNNCRRRPRLVAGLGVICLAFLFFAAVPLSYIQATGYQVKLSDIPQSQMQSASVYQAAFEMLGVSDMSVSSNPDSSGEITLGPFVTADEANQAASKLAGMIADGRLAMTDVQPVVEKRRAPLLAQVLDRDDDQSDEIVIRFVDGKFIINGNGVGMDLDDPEISDDEIRLTVESILNESGVRDACVISAHTDTESGDRVLKMMLVVDSTLLPGENGVEIVVDGEHISSTMYDGKLRSTIDGQSLRLKFPKDSTEGAQTLIIRVPSRTDDAE